MTPAPPGGKQTVRSTREIEPEKCSAQVRSPADDQQHRRFENLMVTMIRAGEEEGFCLDEVRRSSQRR